MKNMEVLPFKQEELLVGKAAKSMSVSQDKQMMQIQQQQQQPQYSSALRGVITMKKRRLKSYFELLPEANPLVKREFGYIENIRNVFTRPLSALPTQSVLGLDELAVKGINGYDQEDLDVLQKTNSTEQNGSQYTGQMLIQDKEKIPLLSGCRTLHNGQSMNDNITSHGVNMLEDIIGSNYHSTQQGYYPSMSPVVTPRCEYPHSNSNNYSNNNTMEFRSLWEGIGGENGIIYSREGEWSNSYKCSLFRITELRRADTPQAQITPDGGSSRKRLDEIIERNLQQEGVLRFESRFESGNLALAGRPKREQNGSTAVGIVSPEESMGSSVIPVAQTATTTTTVLSTSSISLVPSSITTPRKQFLSQPPANPQNTYNLVLQNDINTNGYTQWFCFSVSNVSKGLTATFNILNFYKGGSLFGKGMKVSIYSSISGQQTGWIKGGEDIKYTRNNIIKSNDNYYYTLSFKHTFQHDNDTVTFAYNIPYTYTELQKYLLRCESDLAQVNILNRKLLCRSVAGNRIDLLSITNPTSDLTILNQRQGIVITARVHPGETVSSHIMHGVIQFLLDKTSKEAHQLRDRFVFKVLPMLNPDGVIHGNYRCSLTGCDLNRRWKNPNPTLHPEVYYTKKMIMEFHEKHPISMIIDLHGHSRKKDVFAYGCHDKASPFACREFPFIFSKIDKRFSFKECNFKIQRSREGTARIAMYRELNIANIFTMESTFCGASYDEGSLFSVEDFQQIGQSLCQAIGIKFQVFNNNDDKDSSKQGEQRIKNGNKGGNTLKITDSSKVFLDELYANEDMINVGLRNDSESDSQPSEDNLSDAELKAILRSSKKVKPKLITQTIGIKQSSQQQQQQQSLQPQSASLTQSPSPPQSAGLAANTKKRFMNVTAKIQTIFPPAPAPPASDVKARIRVNVFAKPQQARSRIAASNPPPPIDKSPSPQRSEVPSKIMVAIEPKFMHFPLRGNGGSDAFQTTQDGLFQRRLPEYSQSRKLRDIQARQAGGSGSTSHRMSLQQRIRQGGLSEGSKQVIHLSLQESLQSSQQQQSSYNERQQYNNVTALGTPGIAVAMGSTSWTNPSQSWVNITQNNKSNTIGGTTWNHSVTQSPGNIESPLFSNSVLHGNLQASLDYQSSNTIVSSEHHAAASTKYVDASESLMNLLKSRGGGCVTTDKQSHMNIFGTNSLIRNSLLKQQTNNFLEEQQTQIYQLPSERNDCNNTSPLSRSIHNHSGSFYQQQQQSSPMKSQPQQSQYVSLLNTTKRMNESIDSADNTINNVNSNTISNSVQSNQGIFLPRHYSYVVKPSTAPRSLGIRLRKNYEQSIGDNSILQREDGSMIVSHRKTISDDFSSNHGNSNNSSSGRGYGVSSSFRRIT